MCSSVALVVPPQWFTDTPACSSALRPGMFPPQQAASALHSADATGSMLGAERSGVTLRAVAAGETSCNKQTNKQTNIYTKRKETINKMINKQTKKQITG